MTTTKLRFVDDGEKESVTERKQRLRAYMKERRGDNENRDVKEALLADNLFEGLKLLQKQGKLSSMKTAFVYLSFSSEAPTDKLIQRLKEEGIKVYCPVLEKKEMFTVEHGEDFTLSSYGIREPIGDRFDGDCDFAIVPLLAVDEEGNRLGYGGGYYDRYLRAHARTLKIGYCFDFQVISEVPTDSEDEKMQMIVTDKRLLLP
ncbi:MAG: 5-formyltetrahydrofolate cyclo-ligase [Clostridia bacterium]|nr:5-formyltetrahydrofolate cyclo-ligase [Clostridia bacterium]